MTAHATQFDQPRSGRTCCWSLFLIGFDVAARLLLHVPNVSPVAASALFAGMMLQRRSLALVVPLAAMLIGDAVMGFYDWRVMAVVYAALTLPALAGILARRFRASASSCPPCWPAR